MARGDMLIKVETEPIVKVLCMAMKCRHNSFQRGHGDICRCDYKHIRLDKTGQCTSYETIQEADNGKKA